MDQLNLMPVRQGVLINSTSIFLALFILVYYAKVITLTKQFKVVKEQQELHKNYLELSEANQLKDKTFGMIGHDLRSPLAALKAQLQLLRSRADTNQELSAHSYELNRLVDNIQVLLDNVFHWSLLQQNALAGRKIKLDLRDIVEDALLVYEHIIQLKTLKLERNFRSAPIVGDEYQLLGLVRNLIQNAVKFTPANGVIRIETFVEDEQSYLIVTDSGIGFPEAVDSKTDFSAVQRQGTHGEKGSGMGLTIIHGLTRLNNGQIHYESSPHKGTTAKITFNKALTQRNKKQMPV